MKSFSTNATRCFLRGKTPTRALAAAPASFPSATTAVVVLGEAGCFHLRMQRFSEEEALSFAIRTACEQKRHYFAAASPVLLQQQTASGSSASSSATAQHDALQSAAASAIVTAARSKMDKLGALEQVHRLAETPPAKSEKGGDVHALFGGKGVSLSMVFMSLPKDVRQSLATAATGTTTGTPPSNDVLQKVLAKMILLNKVTEETSVKTTALSARFVSFLALDVKGKTSAVAAPIATAAGAASFTPSVTLEMIDTMPVAELMVKWVVQRSSGSIISSSSPHSTNNNNAHSGSSLAAATGSSGAADGSSGGKVRLSPTGAAADAPSSSSASTPSQPKSLKTPEGYLMEKLPLEPSVIEKVTPLQIYKVLAWLIEPFPNAPTDLAAIYARAASTACPVEFENPFYDASQHRKPVRGSHTATSNADEPVHSAREVMEANPSVFQALAAGTHAEVDYTNTDRVVKPIIKVFVSMKHIIKHYGRFSDVIALMEPYGVFLSDTKLKALRARTHDSIEVSKGVYGNYNVPMPAPTISASQINNSLNPAVPVDQIITRAQTEARLLLQAAPSGWELEDLTTIYQPEMLPGDGRPPPPPTDNAALNAASGKSRTSKDLIRDGGNDFTGVFTPQMLVPIIPTYFVPIELVVPQLAEGYTVEHIESIFMPTGTLEAITLSGQRFIRMHGGNRSVDLMRRGKMGNSYTANETIPAYAPYRPQIRFAQHVMASMKRSGLRPWKWVPLRSVLTEMCDPKIIAEMPFQKYQSLVYFAQMQHMFGFSTSGEGEICYIDPASSANLTFDRTPIPSVVNEIQGLLGSHQGIAIETIIENSSRGEVGDMFADVTVANSGGGSDTLAIINAMSDLSPYSRDLLLEYYDGDLKAFFLSHKEVFTVDEAGNQVTLTNTKRLKVDKNKTLEERLEDAIQGGDRKNARKIRRKMAKAKNPDNPLFDSLRFAEELARFLPRTRHISLRYFMRNLPPEIYDLFPATHMNPFRNHPHLFTLFEYKVPGKLYICRPEIPLPEGHLKMEYTEPEIIQLTAAVLQQYAGRQMSIFSVSGRLPYFAQQYVKTVHKGLFELLKNYPQYFLIVFRESVRMDSRSAFVSLVATPPAVMDDSPLWDASGGGDDTVGGGVAFKRKGGPAGYHHYNPNDANGGDLEEDPDALAELRESIQKAGYVAPVRGGGGGHGASDNDFDMGDD